jgi:Bacterial SH3 domain
MPERRRIPEDSPQKRPSATEDKQPAQPVLPPELPDAEATRAQTVEERTRHLPPVKDMRLIAPQVSNLPEKPKRGQPPERVAKNPARSSPLRLPVWSVLLMLTLVGMSVACIVFAVVALGGRTAPTLPPRFVVLTAAPTVTPAITVPSLLATPTLPAQFQQSAEPAGLVLAGPTLAPIIFTATPTPAPEIAVGSTVQIIGTQGINIRTNPGTENAVLDVVNPGEIFTVIAGPQEANGLRWWQLADSSRNVIGWAADNDGTTDLFQVITP